MTYKYRLIRRAIYEEDPAKKLTMNRSFADMVRLFKRSYWIMLIVFLTIICLLILFAIFQPKSLINLFSMPIIVLISIVIQILREKHLYDKTARITEVSVSLQNYQQYIADIRYLLKINDINTPAKLEILKAECETALKTHEEKFSKMSSKILDMLIGVPLGALIASIIHIDGKVYFTTVLILLIIGSALYFVIILVKTINYYSEGYFKDKYLLDALNELCYFEESLENHLT